MGDECAVEGCIYESINNGRFCEEHEAFVNSPLPPVAIKPDHGSALDENNVCPACFRKYEDDGFKFCTADDCPSHPDYRVAIKPEVALTPLEKEMLAVLRGVSNLLAFESQFFIAKLGGMITNGDQAKIDGVFISLDAVVAKAEAVGA